MFLSRLLLGASLTLAGPAVAGTLSLTISDGDGQPLADAVVTLALENGETAGARPPPRDHFVDQQNETFVPAVEVAAVGDQVIFRNSDRTRHHVYSFSPLATFEFVLKPTETSTPIRLLKPGVVAVGCNIHDFMINYLFVTDARWADKSNDKGLITISDLPAGSYVARFWHPRLRPGTTQPAQKVAVGESTVQAAISLPVLPERRDEGDKDRY